MSPEKTKFDNEGNIHVINRAARRRKPMRPRNISRFGYVDVPANMYTKLTHKIKKIRRKNAPTKQQRIRAIAEARKARRAGYSQVS